MKKIQNGFHMKRLPIKHLKEVVEDQGDNVAFRLTNHSVKEGGSFQSCWNKKKLLSKPAEKDLSLAETWATKPGESELYMEK